MLLLFYWYSWVCVCVQYSAVIKAHPLQSHTHIYICSHCLCLSYAHLMVIYHHRHHHLFFFFFSHRDQLVQNKIPMKGQRQKILIPLYRMVFKCFAVFLSILPLPSVFPLIPKDFQVAENKRWTNEKKIASNDETSCNENGNLLINAHN